MKKLLRSLFTWRTARWAAYAAAALITLIALFYAIEDWRGARAWADAKAKLEAAGIDIDYNNLFPQPVPDEENLAKTPTFVAMLRAKEMKGEKQKNPLASYFESPLSDALMDARGDWRLGTKLNVQQAWQTMLTSEEAADANFNTSNDSTQNPAQELLWQFAPLQPVLYELHKARHRPHFVPEIIPSDFPPDISLPHITMALSVERFLKAHAALALAAGQIEPAVRDLEIMCQLAKGQMASPFIVSLLVAQTMIMDGLDVMWQGLEEHAFDENQLIRLQDTLAQMDFLEAYRDSIQSEMVSMSIATTDALRDDRGKINLLFNAMTPTNEDVKTAYFNSYFLSMYLAPDGWYDQYKAESTSLFQDYYLAAIDTAVRRVNLDKEDKIEKMLVDIGIVDTLISPWKAFLGLSFPALFNTVHRTAETQTQVDLAILALGLERYRQANDGKYPETLDALSPKFLPTDWTIPHDLFTGDSLHYRRVPEKSTYLLYTTGPNQTDDGGTTYANTSDTDSPRYNRKATAENGDWVWPTPAMTIKPAP